MAVQIEVDEMQGCLSYFDWMINSILGNDTGESSEKSKENSDILDFNCADGSIVDICRVMFETDFICCLGTEDTIKNDEIRAKDAMELRRRYAAVVGSDADKSERDTDRIWKSVHGKCSVLELILSICYRLDAMVNEEEPGAMAGMFFRILIGNMGFFSYDPNAKPDDMHLWYKDVIFRFIGRGYNADGSGGGLFPLKKWSAEGGSKDQRTVSIWYQMGAWLDEHLDDEAHFVE